MSRRPALPARPQRGAALLMALIIVTLVSTLAVSMVWQQWRAVQVEAAERARQQSAWILNGALDWSRVILREDALSARRNAKDKSDNLGEPWAVPLAEARLSTFLAADESNADDAPDTFLSGSIVDAQSRYNLSNLVDTQNDALVVVPTELKALVSLCAYLNINPTVAQLIANGMREATAAGIASAAGSASPGVSSASTTPTPLLPQRTDQLTWFGVDAQTVRALEPYVVILRDRDSKPVRGTTVNANTAPKEVLAAVLNVDLATAERLVQTRQRAHFQAKEQFEALLPPNTVTKGVNVDTRFFIVTGRLRLSNQVLEQRSLVQRTGNQVESLTKEWVNSSDPG